MNVHIDGRLKIIFVLRRANINYFHFDIVCKKVENIFFYTRKGIVMNGFDENGTTVGNSKTAGKNMGQFGSTQDVINKRLSIHVGY